MSLVGTFRTCSGSLPMSAVVQSHAVSGTPRLPSLAPGAAAPGKAFSVFDDFHFRPIIIAELLFAALIDDIAAIDSYPAVYELKFEKKRKCSMSAQ